LERLLCQAHDAKRAAELKSERMHESVNKLTQQVADLTALVHAYRCNSYMPGGIASFAGQNVLPEDSSTSADDEDSHERVTAVHTENSLLRMHWRGNRRSVHFVARSTTGCKKLSSSHPHACMVEDQEHDSVKAVNEE
jgi:hypothetical protein